MEHWQRKGVLKCAQKATILSVNYCYVLPLFNAQIYDYSTLLLPSFPSYDLSAALFVSYISVFSDVPVPVVCVCVCVFPT